LDEISAKIRASCDSPSVQRRLTVRDDSIWTTFFYFIFFFVFVFRFFFFRFFLLFLLFEICCAFSPLPHASMRMTHLAGIEVISETLRRRLSQLPANVAIVSVSRIQSTGGQLNRSASNFSTYSATGPRYLSNYSNSSSANSSSSSSNLALGFSSSSITNFETAQQREQSLAESRTPEERERIGEQETYLSFTQILSDYYFDDLFEKLALPARESRLYDREKHEERNE
jgi:signal transduction histidine kinase